MRILNERPGIPRSGARIDDREDGGALAGSGYPCLLRFDAGVPRRSDALGLSGTAHQNVHSYVRLKLTFATDMDLKQIGMVLELLGQLRNKASYNLGWIRAFASTGGALDAVRDATAALTLLDNIDAQPSRRATAIASIRP
jgi:hypothetical protein